MSVFSDTKTEVQRQSEFLSMTLLVAKPRFEPWLLTPEGLVLTTMVFSSYCAVRVQCVRPLMLVWCFR